MKKAKLFLERENYNEKQTVGTLTIFDGNGEGVFQCNTLELPWRDNRRNISCIPVGTYRVKKRYSTKYGDHLHLTDVPARTWILIHPANFVRQLRGCIAVGKHKLDIDGDGLNDVTSSRATMKKIMELVPDEMELQIV